MVPEAPSARPGRPGGGGLVPDRVAGRGDCLPERSEALPGGYERGRSGNGVSATRGMARGAPRRGYGRPGRPLRPARLRGPPVASRGGRLPPDAGPPRRAAGLDLALEDRPRRRGRLGPALRHAPPSGSLRVRPARAGEPLLRRPDGDLRRPHPEGVPREPRPGPAGERAARPVGERPAGACEPLRPPHLLRGPDETVPPLGPSADRGRPRPFRRIPWPSTAGSSISPPSSSRS